MTFLKPSTVLSQTGAYSFKKGVANSATNYIDNNFPNILDKTGDTISGIINVLSGADLIVDSGALLTIDGYQLVNGEIAIGGEILLGNGSLMEVEAGTTQTFNAGSTQFFNGYSQIDGTMQTSVAGAFILGGGSTDYPTFLTARSLSRVALLYLQPLNGGTAWTLNINGSTDPSTGIGGLFNLSDYVIDGATLSSVDIYFIVSSSHVSLPAQPPNAEILRIAAADGLGSGTIYQDMSGTVQFPLPGTVSAWINGGNSQHVNIPITSHGLIDRSTYGYQIQIVDESGSGSHSGNIFCSLKLNFTNILDMRPA